MANTTGEHDVFKLVSLRGSLDGLAIDPGNDGIEVEIASEVTEADWTWPSAELRRAAGGWTSLSAETLRGLPWARLAGVLEEPLTDVLSKLPTMEIDDAGIAEYGTTPEFLASYAKLVDSWVRLRLRRRWGVGKDDATPLVCLHERLIRVAHVIRRVALQRPMDRGLSQRLAVAPIVVPRGHAPRVASRDPAGPRLARRKEIEEAKRSFARLSANIAGLEAIQEKVHAALAERSGSSDTDAPSRLDAAFYAVLDRRLTDSERELLDERVGSDPGARPALLGDLLADLDVGSVIVSANDWCSRIRVFEEEEKIKLPSAQEPQSGPRPSIRALGWGDLVVVRERLVGYDAREIAHIENVLAGEDKAREHERMRRTEELLETETSERVETERDLQTSERFELQAESGKTIASEFSVEAGVNTSGRYGLTRVETSLDVGFQRSVQESQRRSSELAKEVVSRSIEKVQESVRELRRRLTVEELRELNRHSISNTASGEGGEPPSHRVGIYYWVEKIHELQLRQYGTRLMVEFLIPEPGLTLIEQGQAPRPTKPKPAPLAIGPQHISPANYMCLTERYGAESVEPPPPPFAQVGMTWASEVNNSTDAVDAEDTVGKMVKIPEGYAPISGHLVVTGRGRTNNNNDDAIHAQVSVAGRKVLDSGAAPRATYTRAFSIPSPFPTGDEGVPVSARIAGHDDRTATVNVTVICRRSPEAYQKWQLRTYDKIREAHAVLVREYEEAVEETRFEEDSLATIAGRPFEVNRRVERDELKKWAIKTLRIDPFDFDAIVDEGGIQEIDPVASDGQALAVRFFEGAFEWREMSYFLYPYFWGRRAAWTLRTHVRVENDPQHEAFLRAGAARVIVPVTPGYEDRVLQYLESDPTLPDEERISPPADDMPANTEFPDLWLELLLNRREDLALGDGSLNVTQGSVQVTLVDSRWVVSERDLGRELYIGGETYQVAAFDAAGNSFSLDRPYAGPSNPAASYATGTIPFGAPWLARIPTALVVLSDRGADEVMRA